MEYAPDWKSLRKHQVPAWFHDAKFGIFIQWSLSSVPAFAVVGKGDMTEVLRKEGYRGHFKNNPYAEWYLNMLRIEGSPTQQYHKETYGQNFSYYDFVPLFNEAIQNWDPNEWADLFQNVGARYVILVTKHHDGFLLWPSAYKNPHRENYFAARDIVGELTAAVKERDMKMGFYYSGALDWTFNESPIKDFISYVTNGPLDPEYADYVKNHWHELINLYAPSILWNDIGYPPAGDERDLFAFFYNKTPEGVINDRWMKLSKNIRRALKFWPLGSLVSWLAKRALIKGGTSPKLPHCDFITPEYAYFKKSKKQKWESVRGIGNSFGYNKMEPEGNYLTLEKLVHMFIDIVSKNGNLLLDVGPMADGIIPEIQKNLLLQFGKWLETNGEGLFETRPWIRPETQTLDTSEIRFTQKGNILYAFLLGKPSNKSITIKSLIVDKNANIILLGHIDNLKWEQNGENLTVFLPDMPDAPAYGFKIAPKPKK